MTSPVVQIGEQLKHRLGDIHTMYKHTSRSARIQHLLLHTQVCSQRESYHYTQAYWVSNSPRRLLFQIVEFHQRQRCLQTSSDWIQNQTYWGQGDRPFLTKPETRPDRGQSHQTYHSQWYLHTVYEAGAWNNKSDLVFVADHKSAYAYSYISLLFFHTPELLECPLWKWLLATSETLADTGSWVIVEAGAYIYDIEFWSCCDLQLPMHVFWSPKPKASCAICLFQAWENKFRTMGETQLAADHAPQSFTKQMSNHPQSHTL